MKRFLTFTILFFFTFYGHAQTAPSVQATVTLVSIKPLIEDEAGGDEVYLGVVEFLDEEVEHYTIPERPLYWHSDDLDQINNLVVWQAEIGDGETISVWLSLAEQDSLPVDPDDLIGVIKLNLHYKDGKLNADWEPPILRDIATETGSAFEFDLQVSGGPFYKMALQLDYSPIVSAVDD